MSFSNTYSFTVNPDYTLTGITYKNIGTGYNPDGTQAHLGIYGGPFALGNWDFYRYFILDNTYYKKLNNDVWENYKNSLPTEQEFDTDGMTDLNVLNSNVLNLLESSNFKLVMYSKTPELNNLKFKVIPKPCLIESDDILLTDTHKLNSITFTGTCPSNLKIFISPNEGSEWYSYVNNELQIFSKTKENIKNYGMTVTQINSLTSIQLENILNNLNRRIRFLFYFENNTTDSNTVTLDSLVLNMDLVGLYRSISKNIQYICEFINNTTCKISLLESGTYKINY